jgi:cytosine deaminase
MVDVVIRRARLWPSAGPALVDLAVDGGRIVAVGPGLDVQGTQLPADGRLLVPGLVETHLHLDKSRFLSGDVGSGGLEAAVAHISKAKETFTPDAVFERASQTLLACMTHGTTHIRTQVELDPSIELRGLEGVLAAIESFAKEVDVQICVFPQEGLTLNPDTEDLLIQGLTRGATVIGGAPYTDADPRAQIDTIFDLARRFDVDIDMHLDLAETTEGMQIEYVCSKTEEYDFGGRVTVGHVTQLSLLTPEHLGRIARRLADVGVFVTALPATDLFLMGRSAASAKPRGVAPLTELREHGVTCSVATNNVLNSFTPYGDCSLMRIANFYANVAHIAESSGLTDCLSMITDQAAAIVKCRDYGFAIGSPADLVLLDATDPASAVAEIAPALWGMKAGRMTFSRPEVVLHQRDHRRERTLP